MADANIGNKESVQRVIDALNRARSMELHAIKQYMNQHYNLDDMDYGEFAANIKRISIDEMDHAERLAERIKELGGEPTTQAAQKVDQGQKLEDVFPYDINLESHTLEEYNKIRTICLENSDAVSAKLMQDLLEHEQKHFNYFDNTNSHIEKLGSSFLAKIAGTSSDIGETTLGFVDELKGEKVS